MKKYFKTLGLPTFASYEQAKSARNSLIKKYHPDFYKGNVEFAQKKTAEINEAFEKIVEYLEKEQIETRRKIRAKVATNCENRNQFASEKINIKSNQTRKENQAQKLKNKVQDEIEKLKKLRNEENLEKKENFDRQQSFEKQQIFKKKENSNCEIKQDFEEIKCEKLKNEKKILKKENKLKILLKNFNIKLKNSINDKKEKRREKKQNKINETENTLKKRFIKSTLIEDESRTERSKVLDFSIYVLVLLLGVLLVLYFTGVIS